MNASNPEQQKTASVDLSLIPYVKNLPQDGRALWLTAYYDSEKKSWQSYVIHNGKVMPFSFTKLITGFYIAKEPATPDKDIQFNLSELAFQHFGSTKLQSISERLCNDVTNGLVSIQKYFVILNHVNTTKNLIDADLMATEVEFAVTNHRSFYDLLNYAIITVFESAQPRPNKLPDSFGAAAKKPPKELKETFKVPAAIVSFYKEKEKLFSVIRDIRNGIVHHGSSPRTVFYFEDGFGYSVNEKNFSVLREYGLWAENRRKPNNIGCLLEFFALLAEDMLNASSELAQALRACFITLPDAVSPDCHLYFCSELNFHIKRLQFYRTNPWMNPVTGFRDVDLEKPACDSIKN